ncbi:MAG: SPOR domain-containing protein [Candidatus Latescibacterota bacterium]
MKNTFTILLLTFALFASPAAAARSSIPKGIPELIESGKIPEAKERLREFRRKEPDNPLAIFYLARIEDDRNLARALYKEVERLADPDLASEATFARAEMHIEEGDYLAAEPLLVKVVTAHPSGQSYADALYRLGMIRLKADRFEDALVQFRKSRDAQSESFKKTLAAAGIMECYVSQNDWNQALDSAREVLEGPDDTGALTPRVLEVIARAWSELGNDDNAAKFTQRLLNDFPRSYQAYVLREEGNRIAGESAYSLGRAPSGSPAPPQVGERNAAGSDTSGTRRNSLQKGFSIQAGAYVDRFNALKVFNRLRDSGFPTRVDMKTVGEKHFYLVRIGVYENREEADETAIKVAGITGVRATVFMLE